MGIIAFPIGVVLLFVLVGAVGIFGFGQFERAWGAWGSFQVYLWFGFGVALFGTLPFGISASLLRRYPSFPRALALGFGCAALSCGLAWLLPNAWVLAIGFALLACVAPLLCPRSTAASSGHVA